MSGARGGHAGPESGHAHDDGRPGRSPAGGARGAANAGASPAGGARGAANAGGSPAAGARGAANAGRIGGSRAADARDAGDRSQPGAHSHAGHSHGLSGGPIPASGPFRRGLTITFGLTAAFFAVELVTGLIASSLALVADAGHMAADVVALGAALVATKIATRPDPSGRRTYGRYRAEVFAAGLAVLIMVGVGVFVIASSVGRIGHEPHVQSGFMVWVGLAGLVVNAVGLYLLRSGAKKSLNVRGAYLEVLGDAAGSVGVLIAGVLIWITGNPIWDVIVALAIGVFVLVRAIGLGRSVLRVLGQQAPEGMDPVAVEADLAAVSGVAQVHDLHLWTLTSGMNVATAHLVAADGADHHAVLDAARDVLSSRHQIAHATLQVEPADHTSCGEVGW